MNNTIMRQIWIIYDSHIYYLIFLMLFPIDFRQDKKLTKTWQTSNLLFIMYVHVTRVQSSIKVTNHFSPKMYSKVGPQTLVWIKSNGKLLFLQEMEIRYMVTFWPFTKITFERLNRLFNEQMREQRFYWVEGGMPKPFMMKPYLGTCSCFWCCLLAYDFLFWPLDSNKYNPLCSLVIKIIFLVAKSWNKKRKKLPNYSNLL